MVSSSRTSKIENWNDTDLVYYNKGSDPGSCISLSPTGATTSRITVKCSGIYATEIMVLPTGSVRRNYYDVTYTYIIRATSAYNGTTAQITIKFVAYHSTGDEADGN